MSLIEMALKVGLQPRKVSSSKGGEFHSPCPACGGRDRFIIWQEAGRYWCRQCQKSGDAIQFCRDFLGKSFVDACEIVGVDVPFKKEVVVKKAVFEPLPSFRPSGAWLGRALEFIECAHKNALRNFEGLRLLKDRGFSLGTIIAFQLGWNDEDLFEDPKTWGMGREEKKVWLPKGIVVPTFFDKQPMKIKIRRSAWSEGDAKPKYVEVKGSRKAPSFYGDSAQYAVLLEAELDGMLVQQCAKGLCTSIAIGGVQRRPDLDAHLRMQKFDRILFALDFDRPGKGAYKFWKKLYPKLIPWPAPIGKSPGDAFKLNVDLREWVKFGLGKR